ncbi:MAG: PGF-pre-PGF domain-containing protein [Candidatus Nanohaloarchaea archaeon]
MKKQFLVLAAVFFMIGSATAVNARIDQSPPQDVVLKPSNDYTVEKQYSSSASTGDIKSREWNLLGTGQSGKGPTVNFTFDRGSSSTVTVRLTVSNSTSSEVDEVTQVIYDRPNASITATSSTDIQTGENVSFTSTVTNKLNRPANGKVNYRWLVDGSQEGTESTFTHTFNSAGQHQVKLKVTDAAGYSYTTSGITVNVESTDTGEGTTPSPSPGSGITLPPTTPEEPQNDTEQNQTRRGPPENIVRKLAARKGPAQIAIEKASEKANLSIKTQGPTIKGIKIATEATGNITVGFQKVQTKPERIPKPAENIYSYHQINTSLNDTEVKTAQIDFTVNQTWMEKRNASKGSVVMKRFDEGNWTNLQTRYINTTGNQLNFQASTTGFSYYAVALQEQTQNQTETDQRHEQPVTEKAGNQGLMYAVIVIIMLLVVAILYLKREEIQTYLDQR